MRIHNLCIFTCRLGPRSEPNNHSPSKLCWARLRLAQPTSKSINLLGVAKKQEYLSNQYPCYQEHLQFACSPDCALQLDALIDGNLMYHQDVYYLIFLKVKGSSLHLFYPNR